MHLIKITGKNGVFRLFHTDPTFEWGFSNGSTNYKIRKTNSL